MFGRFLIRNVYGLVSWGWIDRSIRCFRPCLFLVRLVRIILRDILLLGSSLGLDCVLLQFCCRRSRRLRIRRIIIMRFFCRCWSLIWFRGLCDRRYSVFWRSLIRDGGRLFGLWMILIWRQVGDHLWGLEGMMLLVFSGRLGFLFRLICRSSCFIFDFWYGFWLL